MSLRSTYFIDLYGRSLHVDVTVLNMLPQLTTAGLRCWPNAKLDEEIRVRLSGSSDPQHRVLLVSMPGRGKLWLPQTKTSPTSATVS